MPYLLIANIFIEAKSLQYGFNFCAAFWEWLDANGVVLSRSRLVVLEKYGANEACFGPHRDS